MMTESEKRVFECLKNVNPKRWGYRIVYRLFEEPVTTEITSLVKKGYLEKFHGAFGHDLLITDKVKADYPELSI